MGDAVYVNKLAAKTHNLAVGSLGAAAASFILKDFTKFQEAKVVVILWLLGAALCDILIAITLVLHLVSSSTGC